MLPFLKKPKSTAALIISQRKPDDSSNDNEHLPAICKILIKAIKNEDEVLLGETLKAAFELFDSQLHAEGPHTNETGD